MMSKNLQPYYTLKCLIRDLLSNVFVSPKFWLAKVFNVSRSRGIRRVQILCDICTRFARYLYSTKQCWIIRKDTYPDLDKEYGGSCNMKLLIKDNTTNSMIGRNWISECSRGWKTKNKGSCPTCTYACSHRTSWPQRQDISYCFYSICISPLVIE